jgi:glycosyltransferase involved in cell wall biosynthesis
MKILINSQHLNGTGGIDRVSRRLISELLNRGHVVDTTSQNPPYDIHLLPANGVVGANVNMLPIDNTPVVSVVHDIIPYITKTGNENYIEKLKKTFEISSHIITVSKYSSESIIREFAPSIPVSVVYSGVLLPVVQYKEIYPEPYLLSVGYGPHKNLDLVLDIITKIDNLILIIVGKQFYVDNVQRDRVKKLVDIGKIIEYGIVNEETLISLYKNAFALLCLSEHEGFGLPVIEAMACGCPVISSCQGGLKEACGNSAFYTQTNQEVINAIQTLTHSNDRRRFVKSGLKYVSMFNWDNTIQEYEQILEKVCR